MEGSRSGLILCGDFNSQPGDLVYGLLEGGVAPPDLAGEMGVGVGTGAEVRVGLNVKSKDRARDRARAET